MPISTLQTLAHVIDGPPSEDLDHRISVHIIYERNILINNVQ